MSTKNLAEIIFCASFQEAERPQSLSDLWYESSSRMISYLSVREQVVKSELDESNFFVFFCDAFFVFSLFF